MVSIVVVQTALVMCLNLVLIDLSDQFILVSAQHRISIWCFLAVCSRSFVFLKLWWGEIRLMFWKYMRV